MVGIELVFVVVQKVVFMSVVGVLDFVFYLLLLVGL